MNLFLVENYLTQQLVMDCSGFLSSNSSDSSEGFEMEDCSNNLVGGGDVLVEETAGGVTEFLEEGDVEMLSLNSVDFEDFATGNDQHEATARSDSRSDLISATGPLVVMVKEEVIYDDDQFSLAQSEIISPSVLSLIEESNARYEAHIAVLEHIEFLKAEELKRISDEVLPQVPVSETSSSLDLTPLQEYKIKLVNDSYRLREANEIQALLDAQQEFSLTQCTGYGVRQGHFVVNRVIEGLLPKINSMQLTQNWLFNTENIF